MFLPCIGSVSHWAAIITSYEAVVHTHHTFQKQSSLSQFDVATANGRLQMSIPTIKATRKGAYSKVEIDYNSKWQIELWRTLNNAYQKSPFFIYYDYKLKPVLLAKERYLMDYNLGVLNALVDMIKIYNKPEIDTTTAVYFVEQPSSIAQPCYPQVFDTKMAFLTDLCVLDVLFNLGPETLDYLRSVNK
jgi:hypothetical protein